MEYEQITASVEEGVALLTLNRPERLNAWTERMTVELAHAIEAANADAQVGAIVLTGAGRGFCAGADMEEAFQPRLAGRAPSGGAEDGSTGLPRGLDWVALVRASKPIVAAVNGAAVGIGLTMILPCDVIVASRVARFGMFFVKVGLVPELASTHFLVQRMGFGRASEMCLSGRLYDASEAYDAGLVDRLVASDELLPNALELAREIGAHPAPQLRWIKELLTRNGCDTDLVAVQRRESERLRACWETPEHRAAVERFLARRSGASG